MKSILFLVACSLCAACCLFAENTAESKPVFNLEIQAIGCKCSKPACNECGQMACSQCKSVFLACEKCKLVKCGCGCGENSELQLVDCGCKSKGKKNLVACKHTKIKAPSVESTPSEVLACKSLKTKKNQA